MGKFDRYSAWSWSSLTLYEQCPKKWYNQYKSKKYKEKKDPEGPMAQGQKVHEEFAWYLQNDTAELPIQHTHHKKFLDFLKQASNTRLVEQELALDRQLQPCGWRDWDDVFIRAKVDFTGITGNEALVVDHKTGKYSPDDTGQLKLQMLVVSVFKPDLDKYTGMFYWTQKRKAREPIEYTRDELTGEWSPILRRASEMQESILAGNFEPKQNFTCKKHCPVKDCPFNGV